MALQLRRKGRNRLYRPKLAMGIPEAPNRRQSMNFLSDRLSRGRRLKILNIADNYSRELVGQLTGLSISSIAAPS